MAARDDYLTMANGGFDDAEIGAMFDEIDQLRGWKAEATVVLAGWDQVWETAGRPGPLGSSKAVSVSRLLETRLGRTE